LFLLDSEGGYQEDPNDAGNHLPDGRKGCTNLGVTQAAWEKYVGHKVSNQDMRDLTPEIVKPFYKQEYWDATLCDSMPSGVDYCLFDLSVNAGCGRSAMVMQSAVGVKVDGQIGPISLAAILGLEPKYVIDRFTEEKIHFYKDLHNYNYEHGWLVRAETVRQRALKMIG
jgi:lysozyme family protein